MPTPGGAVPEGTAPDIRSYGSVWDDIMKKRQLDRFHKTQNGPDEPVRKEAVDAEVSASHSRTAVLMESCGIIYLSFTEKPARLWHLRFC